MIYTPDSLRALADRYPDGPSHATLDGYADAWDTTERARAGQAAEVVRLKRMIEGMADDNADLRKRLDEATESNSAIASAHWELCKRLDTAELDRHELLKDNAALRERLAAEKGRYGCETEWGEGQALAGPAALEGEVKPKGWRGAWLGHGDSTNKSPEQKP
jgi:hypothetical protein